ncbi:hypothetical protein LOZ66_000992 [Ophidiomyces ophidiicola]|nr:hypothetical protein LOZ66_000992 [Ophidiomyces ophidiicola]
MSIKGNLQPLVFGLNFLSQHHCNILELLKTSSLLFNSTFRRMFSYAFFLLLACTANLYAGASPTAGKNAAGSVSVARTDIGSNPIAGREASKEIWRIVYMDEALKHLMPKIRTRQSSLQPDPRTVIDALKADLHSKLKIVQDKKPNFIDGRWAGRTCHVEKGWCLSGMTEYYNYNELVDVSNITISQNVNLEEARRNYTPLPTKLQLVQSRAVANSRTQGWSIGAKVDVKAGDFSLSLSSEYRNTNEKTITDTRQTWDSMDCPPWHECRLETWSFNLIVDGICVQYPHINCGRATNLCTTKPTRAGRDHRTAWTDKGVCRAIRSLAMACGKRKACRVNVPLMKADGKLLSLIASIAVPLKKE